MGIVGVLILGGCDQVGSMLAGEREERAVEREPATHPLPPSAPPHDGVAASFAAAAREWLGGDRYGGSWIRGAVMVVGVVGGPNAADDSGLQPHARGLPYRLVSVDVPLMRLQQVVDELPRLAVWQSVSAAGVDQPANLVRVGVGSRSDVDDVEDTLRRTYPDVTFVVGFEAPLSPA
jgi:hypothetical protein